MSIELAVIIILAIPALAGTIGTILTAIGNRKLDDIKVQLKNNHEEIQICKEGVYYSLQAHVKNGENGNVKAAFDRLNNNIFERKH